MTEPTSIVLTGRAYQRRATLEIRGDALTWRAQKGQVYTTAENIATSVHDVKNVMWLERRGTLVGAGLAVLALLALAYGQFVVGGVTLAVALAYIVFRATHPMRFLGLDLGGRWLVLTVDKTSARDARALATRLEQRLLAGEIAHAPPTLP